MKNAKWTHGWIVGVVITQRASWQTSISTKNMFTPLYLCTQMSSCVFIQERRCLPVHLHHRKSSQSINSPERSNCSAQKEQHYRLMTATRASNWLHHSHFCQAWQYTTDYCWELERETALPLLIIFWHCFPLFLIYDIHLWGNLLLVDFGEHLLPLSFPPCHCCLIKTITDTWLCVWLDSFKNVTL